MSGVNEIRSSFLDYFAKNGHEIVPSSSLVPRNDPTLMFTNAGMVQFKNVFTGVEKRPYNRATSSQKVVRAGGKHNDLDNVGYTARHHTFFEMLGNFSFGDYFKEQAIELAWKLITQEFGLAKDRLLVTVYHTDDEAHALWRKIAGFSDDRIIRIPTSDNFWQMGDTGPCGPCSEIFYDQGEALQGGPPGSPDEDGDRFLEFWNLVFMQYDQIAPGDRVPLPRPSIDTGMGLERIAAILQGVHSNYDIDLMRALIRASAEATGVDADGPQKASHRVIADHLRASSFLVADGVTPSNEGRGYVLRRIMRRAMRHAQLLGAKEPLMWRLVPELVREMGRAYPELVRAETLITETLRTEETRFRTTLARGLAILDDETKTLVAGASLSGETAFKLYDTYGFPLDLTQDALRARGIGVDLPAFDAAMERQRAEARKAWTGSGEAATETIWFAIKDRVGATEFLGYDAERAEGIIKAILRDGQETNELLPGQSGLVIVNQTPFYGESGGQVGDTGLMTAAGITADVKNTQKKLGDLFVHDVEVHKDSAKLVLDMAVELTVDHSRRTAIRANHSATHLLHEALRQVLGDHIAQKGSLVEDSRLRFDFSHPKPITDAELAEIEDIANKVVLQNEPVITRVLGVEDAIASGARALFGEKYGDEVRVVSMGTNAGGDNASGDNSRRDYSVELCGGTHVARTGDIGLITIVAEGAVAAGVRRVEAKTADGARRHLNEEARRLREVAQLLKAPASDAAGRLTNLIDERRKLERELGDARKKLAMGGGAGGGDTAVRDIAGVKFFGRSVSGVEMKDLKSLADEAKQSVGSGIVAIVGVTGDGKAGVVVAVSRDLTDKFNAVDLVRVASEKLGGKGGGGRPDMAQAGGPDGSKADEAVAAIAQALGG
ncbi:MULTISPECIES: alanine--tRNA ligase [unclassified Beijerinckia]|uniref:alanine--tRNA ligase n=1 Tax=unclassified Beijerinckia TaxID=2638183 RepID=UPI00089CAD1D|nr:MULTISPECIES: alanine--tRNA ligase [unclassified Beijerinckia]MDH7798576.1 alanyl-tRNA synthetase [Beijerinckia sp. GAS462]SED25469.1 alanyl-tRNA synthetase [Beijerinckia sp. 28-YEA-48]